MAKVVAGFGNLWTLAVLFTILCGRARVLQLANLSLVAGLPIAGAVWLVTHSTPATFATGVAAITLWFVLMGVSRARHERWPRVVHE